MRLHRSSVLFSFPLAALAAAMQLGGCGTRPSSSSADDAPSKGGTASATAATKTGADYVPLARGAHPLARPEYDVGPLDPNKRLANLSLVFKPTAAQIAERDALRDALTDPKSPSYHQWLTTAQYKARFGARDEDVARASAWLAQQGLEVHAPSPLGARVRFSGRVADLETAFHAEMRQYRVNGELHYAMSTAPSVPADLADVVLGVKNTHDFDAHPRPRPLESRPLFKERPLTKEGNADGLAPADWASIYDVTPLYTTGVKGKPIDGSGVSIAVVGTQTLAQSDVDAFRSAFGLPQATFTPVLVPDTGAAATSGGEGIEAALDVEWAGSLAPGAHVDYFNLGVDDQSEQNDAAYYAIEQNTDAIITESFAYCESYYAPSDQDIWDAFGSAANVLGITYVAASGDWGASGCTPWGISGLWTNSPASFPGVTAVGGTEFPSGTLTYGTNGVSTGYNAGEVAWHELEGATHIGGGGGISSVYSRPAYQSLIPTCTSQGTPPTSADPTKMRQVPDVAVSAGSIGGNNPYWMACTVANGDCSPTGGSPSFFQQAGTSLSAPSFASVVALLVQATGGRLGNINPMLYTLASTTPSAFHDITVGDNRVECTATDVGCPSTKSYGYAAATGYDCATGLGSIDANNLVNAWAALEPTTTTLGASPTALSEGQTVALTASVGVTGTDAHTLGGSVTFAFDSYHGDGSVDLSWTLGTVPVVGGTAALSTTVPLGYARVATSELVDVVAMYGGDTYHLASTSAKTRLTYAPSGFCISPSSARLDPGNTGTFVGVGGGLPMQKWLIMVDQDGTCDLAEANCSSIDSAGVFTGGVGSPGYLLVYGFDQFNTYSVSYVTVGNPTYAPPWDPTTIVPCGTNEISDGGIGPPVPDAGPAPTTEDAGPSGDEDAAVDASVAVDASLPVDAAAPPEVDASVAEDAGASAPASSSGCSCTTAPSHEPSAGAAAGLALGLGLVVRRSRRRRALSP